MRLQPLAFLALAALLLGCVNVNWSNQTVSANISIPLVPIPENLSVTVSAALPGFENATASPTPEGLAVPDKLTACVFGPRNTATDDLFSTALPRGEKNVSLEAKWLGNNAKPMDLEGCALIILNDGGEGRYLDYVPRAAIRQKVLGGSGLIVSQEAGTLVHDDSAVNGWEYILAGVVPVALPESPVNLTVNATFVLTAPDAALDGFAQFNATGLNVTDINVGNGETVAMFRTGPYQTSVAYPAVVRGGAGSGAVYYLSVAPEAAPGVFKAVARFLASDYLDKNFG